MAEVVLTALLRMVFESLSSSLLQEFGHVRGLKKQMERLRSTLLTIQAVLEDAEKLQVKDKAVILWLIKLKHVAYDADDLLTEFMADALQWKMNLREGLRTQVRNFFSPSNSLATRIRMGRRLKAIREELEMIAQERSSFRLPEGGRETRKRPETGSFVIESEVVGRKDERDKIVEMLISASQQSDVSVIPIVGIGGLGKTTLAQLVYNNERVERHFDLKLWVCVCYEFDLRKLLEAIIQSATKSRCDPLEMDVLQSRLQELLHQRRFLIVLDDVWNEDHEDWEKLMTLLGGGHRGSRVIVTTRSQKAALITGTTSPCQLGGLSEDDCWTLFKQRAFSREEEENFPNLLPIGKLLVKKCGGVPLVAKTLGGLMRFKREESEWLLAEESEIWNSLLCDDGFLPSLKLSYDRLPPPVKPCFAYCSIFPRKYELNKEKLIHLWVAEGLIWRSRGNKPLEDIGNDYFNELLWRSFFHDVQTDEDGRIISCKMHDIIHDLALYVTGDEYAILKHRHALNDPAQELHSSVVSNSRLPVSPEAISKMKNLRTLIMLFPQADLTEVPLYVSSSRYLRVLDFSASGIEKLPESIASLKCLKYLDLSNSPLQSLPSSLGQLYNLQTLYLFQCYNLVELPRNTRCLISLRHLNIKGCDMLTHMPPGLGELKHLQTLPMFVVGNRVGGSIKELQCLNIRGELNIKNLENVKNAVEAIVANLKEKQHIHSLGLSWGDHGARIAREDEVLECLRPNSNLKHLSLKWYLGTKFPSWIRESALPNLTVVEFFNCNRCEQLPTLGKLPFLKCLYLNGLHKVQKIGIEFYGEGTSAAFPTLKEFTVEDFPNLLEWQEFPGRGIMPFLGKLIIKGCPRLENVPWLPSVHHLELQNCKQMLLTSAANLSSLSILVINVFPELKYIPGGLLRNNSLLTSLAISFCSKLESLPEDLGKLLSLKSLAICRCDSLSSLPQELQNLTSLTSLEISHCQNIVSLPEGLRGLSSLQSFSIEHCCNLSSLSMGLQHCTALQHLRFMDSPNLASLLTGIQQLSELRSLKLVNCPQLESLPDELEQVKTMENLEIRSCPGLTALPDWVENSASLRSLEISDCYNLKYLPEGLKYLKSLNHLSIRDCPKLEELNEKGREDYAR